MWTFSILLCLQSAMGFEYKEEVQQHTSQKGKSPVWLLTRRQVQEELRPFSFCFFTDYSKGFGGKYGVEREKVDKVALGYDYKGQTEKHQSQKGEFVS